MSANLPKLSIESAIFPCLIKYINYSLFDRLSAQLKFLDGDAILPAEQSRNLASAFAGNFSMNEHI